MAALPSLATFWRILASSTQLSRGEMTRVFTFRQMQREPLPQLSVHEIIGILEQAIDQDRRSCRPSFRAVAPAAADNLGRISARVVYGIRLLVLRSRFEPRHTYIIRNVRLFVQECKRDYCVAR